MKQVLITLTILLLTLHMSAQQKKYAGIAFFNTQAALPFGKFKGMFSDALHPGIEFTYGKNFSTKQKHDWFLEYKLAYFFHQYVQHGVPVYVNLGYRYRITNSFSAETSLGAGYMLSVPAAQVFRENNEILYEKKKGKGRNQVIATFGLGLGYTINPKATSQWRVFTNYQQRIQFPFVKSYVPFLPYNSFMIGITKSIGKNKLKQALKEKKYISPIDRLLIHRTPYNERH